MKKQLLFFIFLLSSITGFSQCNYSFVMSSSGTTGWNGNTMKVRQNGVTVATIGATFTTGSGPQTATVSLQDNMPFDLFWNTGGTIPSQIKISITNSFGQTIYTKPPTVTTQNTILYSGTTDCTQPACIPPASLSIGNITTDAVTLSWTNDPTVTKWEALALPQASPAPSAGTAGIETTTNSIFINGLTCNTTYKAYVRSICGVSATPSAWVMVGSTTFKTLICNTAPMATCVGANSLCGTFGTVYANTTNIATQGTLGCLTTSPNATWFYFSVATPGQINLEIKQSTLADMSTANLDVDYVIYGPYSQIIAPCSGQLTPDKIVSCSYSAAPTEFPSFTVSQTGQYYYLAVTNFNNGAGFIRISELPTTTASLDCKGFRLNAFIDNNANGVKDAGEQSFPNGQFQYEKNNDGSVHNVTTPVGALNIYESNPTNSYDFAYQINPDYTSYYNLPSSAYNDVLINGAGLTDYNFPVTVTNLYNDASVSMASMEQPRPGFLYRNKVIYTNNGNQVIANGTVSFTKDTALSITNISQAGTVATANGFTYDFTNLLPFETRTIEVTMQVPNIPTVQLGNLIHNTASISISNDAIVGNNNFGLSQEIIGSYDPNDVMEAHGEQILYSGFTSDDYLYYTVRFENTGTAAAINVKVHNALNSKLDETSLKIVSASHNYVMDRVGTSVDWDFKSIVLSATSQNPNTSKGYIVYKIKPKAGYVVGDIIPNTASIYFDYNPAIVTNTFNTEFVSQLSVDEFENNNFVFYPNPAHDMITVAVKNSIDEISEIKLYDLSGKIVLAKSYSTIKISETVDLSKVSKGMYFIEVQTKSNLKMIKKLLIE